jgi:hypothetical protein
MSTVLSSKWTKVILFLVCLSPFVLLSIGFYKAFWGTNPNALGANPIEFITHETGDWAIRLLLATLTITPLRLILKQPLFARYRRMLGLFAFFYALAHFSVWFVLDKNFVFSDMWADVLKRRFITVGHHVHCGLGAAAEVQALAESAQADLSVDGRRRDSLLLAGEVRYPLAVDVRRDFRRADAVSVGAIPPERPARTASRRYCGTLTE